MSRASALQHQAYCDSQICDCNDEQCVTCEGWFGAKELRGHRCWECRGDLICWDCEDPHPPSEMYAETLCGDCAINRECDLIDLLDALWGHFVCVDCSRRIRDGKRCQWCRRELQWNAQRKERELTNPSECLRCGKPAGRYFCSQRCEDAERFSEVR